MTIETQTELIVGQVLTQQIKQQTRLDSMRKSVSNYLQRKEVAPPTPAVEPFPKKEKTTKPACQSLPQEMENAIIAWAKCHYNGIDDIKRCATETGIATGKVYHTLKHHSFIQQNETTEYRVLNGYFKHNGRLADITEETGLSVWIVAKTIEKLGYSPKWQEYRDSRYVTKTSSGIGAEAKFKELVPSALDANEELRENMPGYDFIINEKTVDVKESILYSVPRKKEKSWRFYIPALLEDRADFYCFFCLHDREERTNGAYDLLLLPKEVLPECPNNKSGKRQVWIGANQQLDSHQFYFQFKVDPVALSYMLTDEL
ncbi:hypothetical protein ACU6T4_07515 [Avibacterium paragallinarum]|uniref:hypothetical protein n=1 Tax=Avibacterium paragallinarum TaxID=728 RepID=UPI00021AD2F6|nr:hypothetical protein [Avibacterium paragallinarum]AZI13589.1 hypothetical protein EIA51_02395 [Avibacterium paragallinarum]QIR12097.1 hypothetical protein HBL79_07545 [Avibacterium paragallinarum]QJE09083.1 hypothetical protein HHJ62_01505 [Avibacterium paragallinarum]QJE11279.1 hypothetical protein HHJ61_01505 [Avibacterium paragallinarum]QJE13476.1 hypothetical protein HHJ60_01510 [Avibacterium paragallinarum]